MNSTIKCWLIANLETLGGVSFLFFLFACSIHGNSYTKVAQPTDGHIPISHWIIIGMTILIAIYFSILVAIFTYRNFDEVVDRRMLWRNSNVSLFHAQLKYSLSRFGYTFLLIVLVIGSILVLSA